MPLYQERNRRRAKAEQLARGEPIPMKSQFSQKSRTRIVWIMKQVVPPHIPAERGSKWTAVARRMHRILVTAWGRRSLTKMPSPESDLDWYLTDNASTGEMLDAIEAWFLTIQVLTDSRYPDFVRNAEKCESVFRKLVNDVLDDEDLSYQVVGNEVVERSSMVLHANVIEPAMSLLHGRRDLANVETAFQNALGELKPGGDPADAITDASTALQEMLLALGATGNALGPLLKDARKRGFLGLYDEKLVDWVSADRSARGDAHSASDASKEDAWLAIHVVGALLLRLEAHLS